MSARCVLSSLLAFVDEYSMEQSNGVRLRKKLLLSAFKFNVLFDVRQKLGIVPNAMPRGKR